MATSILIIGLPHFVAARDKYNPSVIFNDIETERRQSEISDFVSELSKLDIGTICIESSDQALIDQKYSSFLESNRPQSENEIDQIVFRLGQKIGTEDIYACDFELPMGEFNFPEKIDFVSWQTDFDESLRQNYDKGLRDVILFLNESSASIARVYKEILLHGDETAQDALLRWYRRNLVILQNILRTPGEGRKTLFVGASHVPFIEGLANSLGIEVQNLTDCLRLADNE